MSLNIYFISVFLVDHFTEFSSTDNWWKQVHFEIFPENFKTFLKCLQKMDGRFKELRVGICTFALGVPRMGPKWRNV